MKGGVSGRGNGFDRSDKITEYYKDRNCQYDFIHKVAPLLVGTGRLYCASLKENLTARHDSELATLLIFLFKAVFVPKKPFKMGLEALWNGYAGL